MDEHGRAMGEHVKSRKSDNYVVVLQVYKFFFQKKKAKLAHLN